MRKKSYLLLELMIGFTLIILCALPMMRIPLFAFKAEKAAMEKIELERVSEGIFSDLYGFFLQKQIPFPKDDKKGIQEIPQNFLNNELSPDWELKAFYKIIKVKENATKTKKIYKIETNIKFNKKRKKKSVFSFKQQFFLKYTAQN